jgi:hypothetical protein
MFGHRLSFLRILMVAVLGPIEALPYYIHTSCLRMFVVVLSFWKQLL